MWPRFTRIVPARHLAQEPATWWQARGGYKAPGSWPRCCIHPSYRRERPQYVGPDGLRKGMIVGARSAGASVTATANLVGCARSTVSAVMTAYTRDGKTSSAKRNTGRKKKLGERDRRVLKRIVARNHKQTLAQITAEANRHLQDPVSSRTVQRELHAANIRGRVAIRKPLVSTRNAAKRRQWCRAHQSWSAQRWQHVIWSDESAFTLFQTPGRVYVWRTPTCYPAWPGNSRPL
jgi:transposase